MRDVILWSYMRPELTRDAIDHITTWSELRSLTVVIDGLRPSASELESSWRKQTIKIVEESNKPNLELVVYGTNIGITDHVNRVQRSLLPKLPSAIWVEEDFRLDFEAYEQFLKKMVIPEKTFLACANGQANHTEPNLDLRTLFPPYWGQVVNIALTEEIEKIRFDKKIDSKIARNMLSILHSKLGFPRSYIFEKQIDYWNQYFNWAVYNPNRWDALATYVLWKNENPTYVSPLNHVLDLAETDDRGMNKRHEPQIPIQHALRVLSRNQVDVCFLCERRKSRVSFSTFELVTNKMSYHARYLIKK